jgi:hypothetical protein
MLRDTETRAKRKNEEPKTNQKQNQFEAKEKRGRQKARKEIA